jgi:hypothetical protein
MIKRDQSDEGAEAMARWVSPEQIEANRRNATFSTGPRTVCGRRRSRRNNWTHGMASLAVLSTEQEPVFARRLEACRRFFRVEGEDQLALARTLVMATLQLDACRQEEEACRRRGAATPVGSAAELKRRAAVERRAARLGRDPVRVVKKLRGSLEGCEWLLERWRALARASQQPHSAPEATGSLEPLGDENRRRALDLLGIRLDQRQGPTLLDSPPDATSVADHHAALIATQIADLELVIAALIEKRLVLIARYESRARRLFQKSLEAIRVLQATATGGAAGLVPDPGPAIRVDGVPPEEVDLFRALCA